MLIHDMAEASEVSGIEEFYENSAEHPSCYLLKATEYFE